VKEWFVLESRMTVKCSEHVPGWMKKASWKEIWVFLLLSLFALMLVPMSLALGAVADGSDPPSAITCSVLRENLPLPGSMTRRKIWNGWSESSECAI
jgi:hypothetical protein